MRTVSSIVGKVAAFAFLTSVMLAPFPASAGEWRVMPIRLDFDRNAKTGAITVVNEGKEKINFQLKAYEWTQDQTGKDHYAETTDIVFFPKIMTIDGNGEKVVRAGVMSLPQSREKAYRLFIEEIPQPRKEDSTAIAVALKFGVPLFVKPAKEDVKGSIEAPRLNGSTLSFSVANTGNVHFSISSILVTGKSATGEDTFRKELKGWYLLPGITREHSIEVAPAECSASASVEIAARTDRATYTRNVPLDAGACRR